MPAVSQVVVNVARLDKLTADIGPRSQALLDKAAFDIEAVAKTLARVDTGAMRNSIYVSGASGSSQYGQATSQAMSLRPGVGLTEEVRPGNKFERIIGVAVEYAYWQELNNPFLVPAVEEVRPKFIAAWKELFR